jgi:hypothetical protein
MTLLKIPEFDNKKFQVICRVQLSCQKQVASITADLMLIMGVDCFKIRHFQGRPNRFPPKSWKLPDWNNWCLEKAEAGLQACYLS